LIEPLGFSMEDKHMRRAGLDYHEFATLKRHANWQAFLQSEQPEADRIFALTTRGTRSPYDVAFQAGDWLVFGSETKGISDEVRASFPPDQGLKLPMIEGQRSLNLSNAVAVTVFEAWRQLGFSQPAASPTERTRAD
jgi:tRNA (cytidine/uridine-2'-O-)-methyltransferase